MIRLFFLHGCTAKVGNFNTILFILRLITVYEVFAIIRTSRLSPFTRKISIPFVDVVIAGVTDRGPSAFNSAWAKC